ncbi:unnamed protein product [Auanema sp. JU1783]|nr:unnamed protein product [Auanema sp. JU1783]
MEDEFQVESILAHMSYEQAYKKRNEIGFNPDDKKCNLHSKYVYLVKWEGYNETTWEPESNLEDNIELRKYKTQLNLASQHIRFIAVYPWSDNPELEEEIPIQPIDDKGRGQEMLHNVLQGRKKKGQDKRKAKKKPAKKENEEQKEKKKTKNKKIVLSESESDTEERLSNRESERLRNHLDSNNTIRLTRPETVPKLKIKSSRKRSIDNSDDEIPVITSAPEIENGNDMNKENPAKRLKIKEKYTVSKADGKSDNDLVLVFKKNHDDSSVQPENNYDVFEPKTKSKEKNATLKDIKEKSLPEKKEKSRSGSKPPNLPEDKLSSKGKDEKERIAGKELKDVSNKKGESSLQTGKDKKTPVVATKSVEAIDASKSTRTNVAKVPEKEKWKKPKGTKLIGYEEIINARTTSTLPNVDKDRIDRISCKVRETEEKQRQKALEKEKALRRENEQLPIVRSVVDPAPRTLIHHINSKQGQDLMKKEASTTDSVKEVWDDRLCQNEALQVLKNSAHKICNILNYLSTSSVDSVNTKVNVCMKKSKKHLKWKINDEETRTFMKTQKLMTSIPFRSIPSSRPIEVVTLPGDVPENTTPVEEIFQRNINCLPEAKQVLEKLHANDVSLSASQIEVVLDIACSYGCLRHAHLNKFLHKLKGKTLIFKILSIICSTMTVLPHIHRGNQSMLPDKSLTLFSSESSSSESTMICSADHSKCMTMRTILQWLPASRRYLDRNSPFYVKKFIYCLKNGSHCQRLAYILGGLPLGYSYDLEANYLYIDPIHIALQEENPIFLVDLLKLGFDLNAFAIKVDEGKPGSDSVQSEPMPMIQFYGELEDEEAAKTNNLESSYFYRLRSLVVPFAVRLELFSQTETKSFFSRLGAILDYKGPLTPVHAFRSPSAGSINIISSLTFKNVTYVDHDLQFPQNIISLSTVPKGAIKSEQCVVLLAINNVDILGGECCNGQFRPLAVKRRKTKENPITSAKLIMQTSKKEIELYKECSSDSLTLFRVPKDREEDLRLEICHISLSVSGPMNRMFITQLQLFHVLGN